MAKKNKYYTPGYSDWSIKRTIREAVNVARWNPWLAHTWMREALDRLSLDNPYYSFYDEAVDVINTRWKIQEKFRWYNEVEFWMLDKEIQPPTYLTYVSDI